MVSGSGSCLKHLLLSFITLHGKTHLPMTLPKAPGATSVSCEVSESLASDGKRKGGRGEAEENRTGERVLISRRLS